MSDERLGKPQQLFDLDALDQDSLDAPYEAQLAEYRRVHALPDHAEAVTRYPRLIEELDTDDAPIDQKAVSYLIDQAILVASTLATDPTGVSDGLKEFAARFYGINDTSNEAIIEGFNRYHDYLLHLSWAARNDMTIAQARRNLDAIRPHFVSDDTLHDVLPLNNDPFHDPADDFEVLE